jgi:hypothetical protein
MKSALLSTNFLISHGQATRSTFTYSRVIHFIFFLHLLGLDLTLFAAPRLIEFVKRTIPGFIACQTNVAQLMLVKIGERPQGQATISPLLERRIQRNQRIDSVQDDVAVS